MGRIISWLCGLILSVESFCINIYLTVSINFILKLIRSISESSDEENEEGGGGRRYDRFQAGNATATKKLDIDIDLDEDGKDCELDKKEEEEILGETEAQDEDAKEEKIEWEA